MAMAAAQASLRAEMSPRHFQSSSKQTTASAQKASSAVAEPAVTVQMKGKVTAGGKEQDQGQERVCAFYGSEKGCRFGDKCRFQHNDAR